MSHESLSCIFTVVFEEFGEMTKRIQISEEPIFTLVPVLGAGRSATSMVDVITCELFAQKNPSQICETEEDFSSERIWKSRGPVQD